MRKRLWLGFLSAVFLFCSGCLHQSGRKPVIENWKVVSEITVTCEHEGELTRQVYTNQEKMRSILNCIRQLGQKSTPETDPETLQARTYCITLTHTDGSHRIYCTKADRYIRECRGPWQQADPKKVSELNLLLQTLPGDDPKIGVREDIPRH